MPVGFLGAELEKSLHTLASAGELDESAPHYDEMVSRRVHVREQLSLKLDHFFARIRSVNTERQMTRMYRYMGSCWCTLIPLISDVLRDSAAGTSYMPLVQQVVSDVLDDKVTDVSDLERTSRAIGSLLRCAPCNSTHANDAQFLRLPGSEEAACARCHSDCVCGGWHHRHRDRAHQGDSKQA